MLVLLAASLPSEVRAQVTMGTVTDQSTRAPVRGAFVQLLDATGRQATGALTNERGQFVFRAAAGRYSLKAERIGYQTGAVAPFTLAPGETRSFVMPLEVAALRLKEISVTGGARCTSRPAESRQTAQVWAEARKALTVAAWVETTGAVFQTRAYERDLDEELRPAGNTIYRFKNSTGKQAFSSEKADTLARYGYIRDRAGDVYLYGPDAELLLSNSFLSQHCFKLERKADRPGLLGLGFEPISGRRLPDIKGTLWLDERTAELRYIEYGYTGRALFEDRRYAGGRTEFEQLANGAWVVRRWFVRAPRLQRAVGGRAGVRVAGTHEEGGEILDVNVISGPSTRLVQRYDVRGVVFDSLRSVTLEGAHVYLSGTSFSATSGSGGRFVLDSVPAGDYTLSFFHPLLDSLPAYPPPKAIAVSASMGPFDLATPSVAAAIAQRCSPEEIKKTVEVTRDTTGGGLLFGVIANEFGPVAGARISASWQRVFSASQGANVPFNQISVTPFELYTQSDDRGRFALCGLALDRVLQLRIVPPGSAFVTRDTVSIRGVALKRWNVQLRR